jgi:hypothetical protein
MINNTSSRLFGARSSTATRARLTVGVYILIATAIAAACDVHGVSAPGSLVSISVTPNATIVAGSTEQMTAVGVDGDGRVITITPTWSVAASGGTISSSGMFSAGGTAGVFTNTIVATVGSISGRTSVTVSPGVLASITMLPTSASLGIGATQTFVATGKDAGGNTLTFTPTWSVVAGGGTITAGGAFTAGNTLGVFTNTVEAVSGGITAFATVTVTAGPLATIKVTPVSANLAFNGTQQFAATGADAAGNAVVITPAWTVVASGGAISATGLFTAGTVAGTYSNTVKATSGTISGLASVVVSAVGGGGVLATITVLPNPVSMQISTTQQFTASGKDALGNPFTITPIWSVVNGGGTITASGLFTAGTVAGLFTNTIQATSGTISGLATVTTTTTVTPPAGAANLGTAALNGIMAGTAVTCITGGIINANVSISPGNTVTGFGPCVITGVQHLADAVALQGQLDLTTAYNTLAGLPCPPANAIVGNLGGTTKAAGVYCTAIGIGVSGTLTLDGGGDPNATFVFQAGTSLVTAGNIVLINGAQAKNVWWQVGSSATLGTASQWQGNILTLTSITLVDNATLLGRALARNGAVSLGTNNTITLP